MDVFRSNQNKPNDDYFAFSEFEYNGETLDIFGMSIRKIGQIDKRFLSCERCAFENNDYERCNCNRNTDREVFTYEIVIIAGTKEKKARIICCKMVSSTTMSPKLIRDFIQSNLKRQKIDIVVSLDYDYMEFTIFIELVQICGINDVPANFAKTAIESDLIFVNTFGSPFIEGMYYAMYTFDTIIKKIHVT